MKKYVVCYSCGQYEDRSDGPLGVYDTREDAQQFIDGEKEWKKKTKKLAIRDSDYYSSFDNKDEKTTDKDQYYKLYEEYQDWIWKKVAGNKSEEELVDEDYEKYNEFYEEEWFPKFMKEKGYSDDIIEATIAFNDPSDYSRYNTYYYIKEVPHYPRA